MVNARVGDAAFELIKCDPPLILHWFEESFEQIQCQWNDSKSYTVQDTDVISGLWVLWTRYSIYGKEEMHEELVLIDIQTGICSGRQCGPGHTVRNEEK